MKLAETEITDLDLLNASIKYFDGDVEKGRHFYRSNFFGNRSIYKYNTSLGFKNAIHFKDLKRMVNERFPEDKNFLNVVKKMYENEEIWQQDGDKAHSLRSALFSKHSE